MMEEVMSGKKKSDSISEASNKKNPVPSNIGTATEHVKAMSNNVRQPVSIADLPVSLNSAVLLLEAEIPGQAWWILKQFRRKYFMAMETIEQAANALSSIDDKQVKEISNKILFAIGSLK